MKPTQSNTNSETVPNAPPILVPSTSKASFGHDRQPSVQLKIEQSGGPPLRAKTRFGDRLKRNLNYFCSQLFVLLSQLSPVVQSISALIILIYLIQFSGGSIAVDFFALTPGEIISPGQWYHTIISIWSHVFLETRIYFVVIDLLILSFCGTLIEPLWGHKEVLRFIFICCIPAALFTSIHYILLYCIFFDDSYLFNVRINGFLPFCAAVAVTVKQLLPQSVLIATSFGRLKNDHIPFTVFVFSIFAYLINVLAGVQVVMFTYGVLTSWLYLRFFQPHTRHQSNTAKITRGDLSDSFAFETFFPNVLRPLVSIFSASVYNFLVKLSLCPKIPSPAVRLLEESSSSLQQFSFSKTLVNSGQYMNGISVSQAHEPLLDRVEHL